MAKVSRDRAVAKLWGLGELSWKLSNVQKEIKESVDNDNTKTSVVVLSRRTGKSFWLCVEALSQCLRQPNSIVKFLFPKQKDAKINIQPLMREILEDCPELLKPRFNTQDKIYYFDHNGSQIQLAGSDNGNIESIRGGKAHLVLVDEAGFVSDLKYAIRSVLSPTIRTTGGRIIMASTPSKSPDHEFITDFMIPYLADNRLKIYTIYDNPNFDDQIIKEIIEDYPLGVKDPDFRREYLCEIAIDADKAICPEFSDKKKEMIFTEEECPDIPPHRDFYVSMDVGFVDLTVALFGYYDFKDATLVIMDELVTNGAEMTTESLVKDIRHKERIRFFDHTANMECAPYLRVMDNDLKLINDLGRLHEMTFIPTAKDNKEAAVNNMRIWVSQGRVRIHERCKHLIYHLEFGQWDKSRRKFKHLNDSPDKSIRGGHVDSVDAIVYLIRNIHEHRNPFPEDYGQLSGNNVWRKPKQDDSEINSIMQKIMNIKKS